MLTKRRLVLSPSAVLIEPLLRREDIADTQLAAEVLSNARREAALILEEARHQAQQEKDDALGQFWASANQFLQALNQQRQALERESMVAVEALLTSTLARLLDESTLAERTRALVRNLADSQPYETQATLGAHPDMLDDLRQWLAQSRFAEYWQLKADASLAPQSLRLSDANGAFDIDWTSLRRGLLGVSGDE
jgi:type III secretion protein L